MITRTAIRAWPKAAPIDPISSIFSWACHQARLRRDRRHLHAMPDYLLKDIGIARFDIDEALIHGRGPFE